MRHPARLTVMFFAVMMLLMTGCRQTETNTTDEQQKTYYADQERERISVFRQGLSRNFVLTEEGIYCIRQEENGNQFILYCEKDSDRFVKLCGRPDCLHRDDSCNAWLPDTVSRLHYYAGRLYYIDHSMVTDQMVTDLSGQKAFQRQAVILYSMDKSGNHKTVETAVYPESEISDYIGAEVEEYSLGYVKIGLIQKDDKGLSHFIRRYGSLADPDYFTALPGPETDEAFNGLLVNTWGEEILLEYPKKQDGATNAAMQAIRVLYRWNPREETIKEVGEVPGDRYTSILQDGAYYAEDGHVYRWDYTDQSAVLIAETGFTEGNVLYHLPDCWIITDGIKEQEREESNIITARFYDLRFAELGECRIACREGSFWGAVLFGETEGRILFSNSDIDDLPAYYIEKSDFGTGEIRLHEYHFPEE